jgi:hypothetical protein
MKFGLSFGQTERRGHTPHHQHRVMLEFVFVCNCVPLLFQSLFHSVIWCFIFPQSLLLLAYLIRNGSERVVTSAREHIYDLRSLENYHFVGEQ